MQAALGNIMKMRIMLENDMKQRRIRLNMLMNRDKLLEFDIDTVYTVRDYSNAVFDSAAIYGVRSDIRAIDQEISS